MPTKRRVGLNLFLALSGATCSAATGFETQATRPDDIVDVQEFLHNDKHRHVQFDLRYRTYYNFIGRPIAGYGADKCLLTRAAAQALETAVDKLEPFGLTFRIYDCYRPQRAVNDFVAWAQMPDKQEMKAEFYPEVDKRDLFKEGYIAERSAHSRGSAVDLTIVSIDSTFPSYETAESVRNFAAVNSTTMEKRTHDDNTLDFGTRFDFFSPASHPLFQNLTGPQHANRLLLQNLMTQAGFRSITTEWWHFYLANEPYPNTYFDFPIE